MERQGRQAAAAGAQGARGREDGSEISMYLYCVTTTQRIHSMVVQIRYYMYMIAVLFFSFVVGNLTKFDRYNL